MARGRNSKRLSHWDTASCCRTSGTVHMLREALNQKVAEISCDDYYKYDEMLDNYTSISSQERVELYNFLGMAMNNILSRNRRQI